MSGKKRKITIAAILFMTTTLLYASLDRSATLFDEAAWESSINLQNGPLFHEKHETDGWFYNPWMPMPEKGIFTMLKWRLSDKATYEDDEENFLPGVNEITAEYINSNDNFMTWIGHASVLIKTSGHVFILDPIFGDLPLLKKRRTPSALSFDEASKIKGKLTVLITHNHYDHFDTESIESFPAGTEFIVPKGLAHEINDIRESVVTEADWWQEIIAGGVKIVFLPSQHWSKRGLFDTNKSLWGSYLIDTGGKKLFICGDTGYSTVYKEIGSRYPGIDYALMSTGASQPRWFMHYAHQNEKEAVRGFRELGAKTMIPIHWGSFSLGDGPAGYPAIHVKRLFSNAVILNGGDIIKL